MINRETNKSLGSRSSRLIVIASALISLTYVAFLGSCGGGPTQISPDQGTGYAGKGSVDPRSQADFLLASMGGGDFAAGRIEVWGFNLHFEPDSGNVSFDAVIVNATDHPISAPIRFVVISIVPWDIKVVNPDGMNDEGHPFFDFSSKLGGDNVLEPGERSEPVKFIFHTGEPRPFSIGFRLDFLWGRLAGIIGGVVFEDINRNGIRELGEPGLPGVPVSLEAALSNGAVFHRLTRTDDFGAYRFAELEAGVYTVSAEVAHDWISTTPNPLIVALVKNEDGVVGSFLEAHFGLFHVVVPPGASIFGPILVGPRSRLGSVVDTAFVIPRKDTNNKYFLGIEPPITYDPLPFVIDSVKVLINGWLIFEFKSRGEQGFHPVVVEIPEGLLRIGENEIFIDVQGNENSALFFKVFFEVVETSRGGTSGQ